jgi:cation:H+ antiporter
MDIFISSSFVLFGLILLILGADRLILGAVGLARRARISETVIGATIIAAGTSTPELVASLAGAWTGHYGLAVGNVVGSNSFNIGLILGLVGLIAPMAVSQEIMRRDWWVMAATSVLLVGFVISTTAADGSGMLPRWFCALLFGLFIVSVWWSIRSGTSQEEAPHDSPGTGTSLLWIALGIALLTGGGWLLVKGAVTLASAAGISDTLIGLTIVAAGTSAPELITSLLAARRGQHAIAVANIVGSNTFNILGILGLTGLFGALPVAAPMVRVDLWVMLGFAFVLPLAWGLSRGRIGRNGAAIMLIGYLSYLGWLIADAQRH